MCQPKAPSPTSIISQQTQSNKDTAIAQAGLNMVNQTDAAGNQLTFQQIGKWADGTPQFSSTQTLGAAGQALQAANQGTAQNLANLAKEQSGRLSGLLNQPLDWSAQQGYLNDLTEQNLNPQWDRMAERNEQALVNRGLRPGSTAYNNAQNDFAQSRSSAYNNANLSNYNSALQSQLALRNQPLSEILALAGGSQLQTPSFGATPQTGVGGVDTAGITQSAFQNQQNQWANNQGIIGGLFSAGASLLPLLSDIRVKTNIARIGTHPIGVGVYEYDRIDTGDHEVGVLAQEVAMVRPDMVDTSYPDGLLRVRYGMLNEVAE